MGTCVDMDQILNSQRKYFTSGATLPIEFRLKMLNRLYDVIKRRENEICDALKQDLGKSNFEAFMCEVGLSLNEISYMIRHTPRFAAEKRVPTPLAQFCSRSYTKPVPYGNVLIMSPWNYPFLLTIDPLAEAIAAGNTIIVKPSAYSPATADIVKSIIEECFEPHYVACVLGSRKENSELLHKKFDLIFFTGSQNVGKEVLHSAAEHLTPVVLELGGKSPCIVDETAKIPLAAKRIVFGKYLNCGQTCVAPDYILCQKDVKEDFLREVCRQIKLQFGENPLENPDYGKIVNEKHFARLCGLLDANKVVAGGQTCKERLQIAPTVMDGVMPSDPVMQEEIFGPIMPIMTYDTLNEVISFVEEGQKPLALYLFSEDRSHIKTITSRCSYGGGCINDCVIHLATSEMGFGGVGESGMGAYHGKRGFETFSHTKSIVDKKTWMDLPMRYQPYESKLYQKLVRMFLK